MLKSQTNKRRNHNKDWHCGRFIYLEMLHSFARHASNGHRPIYLYISNVITVQTPNSNVVQLPPQHFPSSWITYVEYAQRVTNIVNSVTIRSLNKGIS